MSAPEIRTASSKDELADLVTREAIAVLAQAQQQRGRASIALTGGTMGTKSVAALAAASRTTEQDLNWSRIDFWWSDERFLPRGDSERNVQQAMDAVTAAAPELQLPPENVHVIGSADEFSTPEDSAQDYLDELRAAAADQGTGGLPPLDIALLGVGPDGHVASVFPGHPELEIEEATVVAVHDSPKPPPLRVSMTLPLIRTAAHVWFVVAGENKTEAVGRLLAGGPLEQTPACGARGTVSTRLYGTPDALPEGRG